MENTEKQLSLPANAVTDKGAIVPVRVFISQKFGRTVVKGESTKQVVEALIASGVHKDAIKDARKELDGIRGEAYRQYNVINGAFAADPSYRKTMKMWKNNKGETCATTQYRKERSLATSAVARLQAEIVELKAKLAALPA